MTQLHPAGAPPPPAYAEYPPQRPAPPMQAPPPPPHLQPRRRRTGTATLALAALAVILAAAALIVALLRPGPTPVPPAAKPSPVAPAYSNEQTAAAKAKACNAAKNINDRLLIETNWPRPSGPDDALGLAHRASARTDYLAAAVWLPTQVDVATPNDLRAAVTAYASAAGDAFGSSADADQLHRAHAVMSSSYEQIERSCG